MFTRWGRAQRISFELGPVSDSVDIRQNSRFLSLLHIGACSSALFMDNENNIPSEALRGIPCSNFPLIFWYTNLYMVLDHFITINLVLWFVNCWIFLTEIHTKIAQCFGWAIPSANISSVVFQGFLDLLDSPLLTALSTGCKLPVGYVPQIPWSVLVSWDLWIKAAHHGPAWFPKCVSVSHWRRTVSAADNTLIPDAKENSEMKTLQQLKCSYFIKTS